MRRLLDRQARRLVPFVNRLVLSPELREWRRINGDLTKRLDYPLVASDLVADVGAYHGQFASDIYGRFRCKVHAYEPIAANAASLQSRFASNPDMTIHHYGLAARARADRIHVDADSSSVISGGQEIEEISLASVVEEVDRLGEIALMKVNIEGLEYELLDSLITSGRISRVKFLQVQFHDFVPDAYRLRHDICQSLKATHRVQWSYPFVWESWETNG